MPHYEHNSASVEMLYYGTAWFQLLKVSMDTGGNAESPQNNIIPPNVIIQVLKWPFHVLTGSFRSGMYYVTLQKVNMNQGGKN